MIYRREPAMWSALASSVIALFSALVLPLTTTQQGVLNALVVAILGVITAVVLKSDGISAAALGLVKAAVAVGIAFGLAWSPETQAVVISFAAAVTGMFVRTQETAPASATVRPDPEPHTV